jgi:NADH dehydrogenase [ubiquinone] 1 alpha subcomplex assembly factor 7
MAIYYLTRWMASSGKKVRLVELGPGRGTLMDDMLRVSQYFFIRYIISVLPG